MKKFRLLSMLRSRRIQFDIIVIFVVLFLGTCITIITYTYSHQADAILKLSKQLIQRSEFEVIEAIHQYLKPPSVSEVTSYLLRRGTLSFEKKQRLINYMEDIIQSYPHITSVYVADTQGNFVEETRQVHTRQCPNGEPCKIPPGSQLITRVIQRENSHPSEIWIYKGRDKEVLATYSFKKDLFDPRSRDWYLGAQKISKQFWLGAYRFFYSKEPGITISFPIRSQAGKIIGVVGVDYQINQIQQFLNQQRVGKHGIIVITDNNGQIVAMSNSPQNLKNLDNGKSLIDIQKIGIAPLRAAYAQYKSQQQNYFIFEHGGNKFVGAFAPFSAGSERVWLLGLVTPVSDFVKPILESSEFVLVISLIAMMVGIALIVIVSHQLSKGVVKLAQEATNISEFKLDETVDIKTHVREIQVLLNALRALKSSIKSFSKYVPHDLVKKLFASGEVAQLSASKRTLTVMFSDIVSFSRISEAIREEQLLQMLSEYLGIFTHVIKQFHGTLDKYIGDAVMAFWGAPAADSDHVMHACLTALECRRKIDELNHLWRKQGYPEFRTRFGINTGPMIVGNLGSAKRLNYTVVGDNVNLAARLQSINKFYGSSIVISEAVYEVVAERLLCRPLDYVRVKGKMREVMLYELIADRESAYPPTNEEVELCELTSRGYHAYIKEEYESALRVYQQILTKFPHDEVSQLYIQRCQTLLGL